MNLGTKTLVGALVIAAATFAAGCGGGGGSGSGDPAQVTEDFFNAIAAGDGETACGLLSKVGLGNIPKDPNKCAEEVSSLSEEQRSMFEPSNVEQVTGHTEHCGTIKPSETDAETVATVNGDVQCVNLSKIDGEWKINDT